LNLEYYDPFPYGTSTDNGDGAHLFVNSNGLNFLASKGVVFSTAVSLGATWASSFISASPSGAMLMPATGGFFQIRVQQADSTQGGWGVPLWFLPVSPAPNADPNWDAEGGYTINGASTGNVANGVGIDDETNGWLRLSGGPQFNTAFHIFGTEYIPGVSIKYFLDNQLQLTLTPGSCVASNGGLCQSGVTPPTEVCTTELISESAICFPTGAFQVQFGMQEMGNNLDAFNNTSPCGSTPCETETSGFHTWASTSTTGPYTMIVNDVQRYKVPGGT
jgi:hypothetical protein